VPSIEAGGRHEIGATVPLRGEAND
jgi:hypothetical protein